MDRIFVYENIFAPGVCLPLPRNNIHVIFRELFLRVIDINYEGAEPPSSLYQLRVEQF